MAAVRRITAQITYNPDTGSYTVFSAAGHYVGSTTDRGVADRWAASELQAGSPCPNGCEVGYPGQKRPERLTVNCDGELSCPTCWECFGIVGAVIVAARLGSEHGRAGVQPYGDVSDGGSALLMDALGETEPTTEENAPLRLALVDAYLAAYEAAEGQS